MNYFEFYVEAETEQEARLLVINKRAEIVKTCSCGNQTPLENYEDVCEECR